MVQTIIVFLIFFCAVAYLGFKFFKKDKSPGGSCSKCVSGKMTPEVKE